MKRSKVKADKACEHCPNTILNAVQTCVATIPRNLSCKIGSIGFCGQMHSCICWNGSKVRGSFCTYDSLTGRYELSRNAVCSPLFSWQDGRCSQEFLASLPVDNLLPYPIVHSGFGCATISWFAAHDKPYLAQFDCIASIMDWIVWIVCALPKPLISDHLAASFGFYNLDKKTWNDTNLKMIGHFPLANLPAVRVAGSQIGKLSQKWLGISAGTRVFIPLGDSQCAMHSVLVDLPDDLDADPKSALTKSAVLNCGTSMQLGTAVSIETAHSYQKHQDIFWALKYERLLRKTKRTFDRKRSKNKNKSDSESIGSSEKSISSVNFSSEESASKASKSLSISPPKETKLNHESKSVVLKVVAGPSNQSVSKREASKWTAEDKPSKRTTRSLLPGKKYEFDLNVKTSSLPGPMSRMIQLRQEAFADRTIHLQLQKLIIQKCFECLTFVPYLNNEYLAVAASLNGGNVIAAYIRSLREHVQFLSGHTISEELIWKRLLSLNDGKAYDPLNNQQSFIVNPLLNGERHVPEQALALFNVNRHNFTFGDFFDKLCKALVVNIFRMFPVYLLKRFGVKRVYAVGNTFVQNSIMSTFLKERLQSQRLQVRLECDCDADYGVALITADNVRPSVP
jgi:hypothetical protein